MKIKVDMNVLKVNDYDDGAFYEVESENGADLFYLTDTETGETVKLTGKGLKTLGADVYTIKETLYLLSMAQDDEKYYTDNASDFITEAEYKQLQEEDFADGYEAVEFDIVG